MVTSADGVLSALRARTSPAELPLMRRRLRDDEPALGMRMKDLFAVAKSATDLPLAEVERLLAQAAYEPRMAAFCILDFKARRDLGSQDLYELYLRRHDAITTWDMVDRAAPRVVGAAIAGGPYDVLRELAASPDPLRRRTAITAPLYYAKTGVPEDLSAGFEIAGLLCTDPDPVVHLAVGTFLKHGGRREPAELARFLARHGDSMPRPARRLATRP